MILTAALAEHDRKAAQGPWMPAAGGAETPFTTRTGRRLLYVWQASTGRHAYLDLGSDLILSQEEADAALALHLPPTDPIPSAWRERMARGPRGRYLTTKGTRKPRRLHVR